VTLDFGDNLTGTLIILGRYGLWVYCATLLTKIVLALMLRAQGVRRAQ
jgi:hypothetical protein